MVRHPGNRRVRVYIGNRQHSLPYPRLVPSQTFPSSDGMIHHNKRQPRKGKNQHDSQPPIHPCSQPIKPAHRGYEERRLTRPATHELNPSSVSLPNRISSLTHLAVSQNAELSMISAGFLLRSCGGSSLPVGAVNACEGVGWNDSMALSTMGRSKVCSRSSNVPTRSMGNGNTGISVFGTCCFFFWGGGEEDMNWM
jgi:hypothetical protein